MENNCRLHKKRTAVGYFLLGVMSFFVGIFYGLYDDGILVPSLEDTLQIFMGNLQAILYAVASSMIFYYVFFSIRKKIDDIKTERDEEGMVKHILTEKELLDLRDCYLKIKGKKRQRTDEPVEKKDISASGESEHTKKALGKWMEYRKKVIGIAAIYLLAIIVILIFMQGIPNMKAQFWNFFAPYTLLFAFATCFYAILFFTLRIESFMRLSYSVLYPTVLTIAVNIYFGLSIKALCSQSVSPPVYMPIAVFFVFFVLTAVIELVSYKLKNQHFSTYGFVGISLFVLAGSIMVFSYTSHFMVCEAYKDAFSRLLFAIALAIYLGIFEGWDALRNMNIDEKSPLFARHYRWWNFLQLCYPLAFFFLMGLVKSEIFTFGLMISFAVVSVASTVVWKRGGEKEVYSGTNWGMRKLLFGLVTVMLIFANRFFFMSGMAGLKNPPGNLNTGELNVELIVVLLGALNWMFVFWGVKEEEKKRFVLMALPLKEVEDYKEFCDFCRRGYIYDFCNYIYLIYILVVHVLLFSTGFLPEGRERFETAAAILIILIVIIYMCLSFKAKVVTNKVNE